MIPLPPLLQLDLVPKHLLYRNLEDIPVSFMFLLLIRAMKTPQGKLQQVESHAQDISILCSPTLPSVDFIELNEHRELLRKEKQVTKRQIL